MTAPQATLDELVRFLQATAIFAAVPEAALRMIAGQLEYRTYAAGERVIGEGEPGDSLLLVWRGSLRVFTRGFDGAEIFLNDVAVGEAVGEIAMLTGERRTATVFAGVPSELLQLDRVQLTWLAEHEPGAAEVIHQAIIRRLTQSQLNLALHRSRVFEGLAAPVMQQLRHELELQLLHGGETVIRQGEASDALYLIVNGRLRVVLEQADGEATLYELRPGQSVGEAGIITGQPRTATVYAVRDSLLARLSRERFERLLAAYPQAMMQQFAAPLIRLLGEQANTPRRYQRDKHLRLEGALAPAEPVCAAARSSHHEQYYGSCRCAQ